MAGANKVVSAVEPEKSAVRRNGPSKVALWLLAQEWMGRHLTCFDYGCGHRGDELFFLAHGITCRSWDPYLYRDEEKVVSDVVLLAYVINVIEDAEERTRVLQEAWSLCQTCLVVAARTKPLIAPSTPLSDGRRTSINTFQKVYLPHELLAFVRSALETRLNETCLPIELVDDDLVIIWKRSPSSSPDGPSAWQ